MVYRCLVIHGVTNRRTVGLPYVLVTVARMLQSWVGCADVVCITAFNFVLPYHDVISSAVMADFLLWWPIVCLANAVLFFFLVGGVPFVDIVFFRVKLYSVVPAVIRSLERVLNALVVVFARGRAKNMYTALA